MAFFDYPLDNKLEASIVSLNKNAMEAMHSKNYTVASSLLQKSLHILKLSKPSESIFKLNSVTLNNLGILHMRMQELQKALAFLSAALEAGRNLTGDTNNRAGTHLNICAIKSGLGQHEQALQHALTAIQMLSGRKVEVSQSLIIAYHSAGIEYQHLGFPLKAMRCFDQGYELAAQKLGKNHPLTLSLQNAMKDFHGYSQKTRHKPMRNEKKSLVYEGSDIKLDVTPWRSPGKISPIRTAQNLSAPRGVKNVKEDSFLDKNRKIHKRRFVRDETIANRMIKNKILEKSFKDFSRKVVSELEGRNEIEESESFEKESFEEKVSENSNHEEMFMKFKQEIKSDKKSIDDEEIFTTANGNEYKYSRIEDYAEKGEGFDKESSKEEDKIEVQSGSSMKDSQEYESVSEKSVGETPEIKLNKAKLDEVESTLIQLDEKFQAFSKDCKDHLDFEPEASSESSDEVLPAINRDKITVVIQKHIRSWQARRKYKKLQSSSKKIQSWWRDIRYKQYLKLVKGKKLDFAQQCMPSSFVPIIPISTSSAQTDPKSCSAISTITNSLTFINPKNLHKSFFNTLVKIQSLIRGFLSRCHARKKRLNILKIQSTIRMYQTRKIFNSILQAIEFIQFSYRIHLQQKRKKPIKTRIRQ